MGIFMGLFGGIGKAISSVADFAGDILGNGVAPIADIASTAFGLPPLGSIASAGVSFAQAVTGNNNVGLQNIIKTAMPIATTYAQNQAINDATKIAQQTADKQLSILEKQYNLTRSDLLNAVKNGQIALDKSTQNAINTLNQTYAKVGRYNNTALDKITNRLTPYMSVGDLAFMQQNDLLGINGKNAQQRAYSVMESSPQFQTLMKQSENALLQNASATGGLRGGNTQRALAELRPNLLNQLVQQQLGNLGNVAQTGLNVKQGLGNTETSFAGQNQVLQTGLANTVGGLQSGLGINKAELGLKAPQTLGLINSAYGGNVANVLGGLGETQQNTLLQKSINNAGLAGNVTQNTSQGGLGGLGGVLGNIGNVFGSGGFDLNNTMGGIFNSGGGGSFGIGGLGGQPTTATPSFNLGGSTGFGLGGFGF